MKSHRVIRIFISSTFCDFEKEREILNDEIFPALRKRFGGSGKDKYYLQFVDLRWGVPNTAEQTHDTMKICLKELTRSREISPNSYLYIMLGDRYGWQPVPDTISCDDYAIIKKHIKDLVVGRKRVKAPELFDRWYNQDGNSKEGDYVLLPVNSQERSWKDDEPLIRSVLDEIQDEVALSEKSIVRYYYSATGQEIAEGALLKQKECATCCAIPVSCFFRKIVGCDSYTDVVNSKYSRLQSLHNRLEYAFPTMEATIDVTKENYSYKHYLEEFRLKTETLLSTMIQTKIQHDRFNDKNKEYINEEDAHSEFCRERVDNFVGRDKELKKISRFIRQNKKSIAIINGGRGVGKSAFIAKAATEVPKKFSEKNKDKELVVITRFVGVTASSNDLFSLLCNFYEAIWRKYHSTKDEFKAPANYTSAIVMFKEALSLATPERPLLIVIDALDQLPYTDDFKWIPKSLPANVKIILGTRKEKGYYKKLLKGINLSKSTITLKRLNIKDSKEALNNWLNKSDRTSVESLDQWDIISRVIEEPSLPIYLKLLYEKIKMWRSFDKFTCDDLKIDSQGMIEDYFFNEMYNTKGHSKELVRRSLAYISLGMNGLPEQEVIDLLSNDTIIMEDLKRLSYNDIPIDKDVPFMIWARFYGDIEPYMKLILSFGDLNITFYHPQIAEAVKKETMNIAEEINKKLIEYYRGRVHIGDVRALTSLPYHIMNIADKGERDGKMSNLLKDNEYIQAKIKSQLLSDLVSEYEWFVNQNTTDSEIVIKQLFITVATMANNNNQSSDADKKKLWDDVHAAMIFRFDRKVHKMFFDLGVKKEDISDNQRLSLKFSSKEWQFIKICCLLSKQNYHRRMGSITEAINIGDALNIDSMPHVFRSMAYYDKAYITFLANGTAKNVLQYMEKSCQKASDSAKGCFSMVVGYFVTSRLSLFNEEKYAEMVTKYLDYVEKNLNVFASKETSDFGRNKLSNILEHIGIICYYNNDEDGAQKALKLFLVQPVVKSSTDKTREMLANAMLLGLKAQKLDEDQKRQKEKYKEACDEMQKLIDYKIDQVSLENSEDIKDQKRLIESVAQMYYLCAVWSKKAGLCDITSEAINSLNSLQLTGGNTNDNGNQSWCNASRDYKFNQNSSIKDKVDPILTNIEEYINKQKS